MSLARKPDSWIRDRRRGGRADPTVGVGDLIALPILAGLDGRPVDLIELAAGRSVVLVLHRGGPDAHGTATLAAYTAALPRIEAAGGTLIAVTSEPSDAASATGLINRGLFPVVVDEGHRFAQSLGLVATPPDRASGIHLPARAGGEGPWPAVYVLAPCGRVTYALVEPDLARRPDTGDAVAALERLARRPADRRQTPGDDAASWESLR